MFGDAPKRIKCPGKWKIFKNNTTQTPILNNIHTHPPNTHAVEVNKYLARMKLNSVEI